LALASARTSANNDSRSDRQKLIFTRILRILASLMAHSRALRWLAFLLYGLVHVGGSAAHFAPVFGLHARNAAAIESTTISNAICTCGHAHGVADSQSQVSALSKTSWKGLENTGAACHGQCALCQHFYKAQSVAGPTTLFEWQLFAGEYVANSSSSALSSLTTGFLARGPPVIA
jgi:hypothetical protein